MQIEKNKLERVVETAKIKAAGNARWLAAIDKAVEGLLGTWIVTELHDGIMVTTENGTYHANGSCQCHAYHRNQPCKHRACARLVELYREAEKASPSPTRDEILADATDAQRNKVLDLGGRAKLRGGDYTLRRDGKNIVVDDGKAWTVDRKGKVTWDEVEGAVVDGQPWSIEQPTSPLDIRRTPTTPTDTFLSILDANAFDEMASSPIVKPQPEGTYYGGWSI